MRLVFASLILIASVLPAATQNKSYEIPQPTGPWRVPGEIRSRARSGRARRNPGSWASRP